MDMAVTTAYYNFQVGLCHVDDCISDLLFVLLEYDGMVISHKVAATTLDKTAFETINDNISRSLVITCLNLKVTFMLEFPDEAERKVRLN